MEGRAAHLFPEQAKVSLELAEWTNKQIATEQGFNGLSALGRTDGLAPAFLAAGWEGSWDSPGSLGTEPGDYSMVCSECLSRVRNRR